MPQNAAPAHSRHAAGLGVEMIFYKCATECILRSLSRERCLDRSGGEGPSRAYWPVPGGTFFKLPRLREASLLSPFVSHGIRYKRNLFNNL